MFVSQRTLLAASRDRRFYLRLRNPVTDDHFLPAVESCLVGRTISEEAATPEFPRFAKALPGNPHDSSPSGTIALPPALPRSWQAENISRMHWWHFASTQVGSQQQSAWRLCRNCGRCGLLVETFGKDGN